MKKTKKFTKKQLKGAKEFGKKFEAIKHISPLCVQCNRPLFRKIVTWDNIYICDRPDCPNYGLLQINQHYI
jgi:hypothetical protein